MAEIMRPRFNVVIVLPTFEITGAIEPIGPWLDFMNSRDKHVITVYAARVMPIGAAAPAGPEQPQMLVNRDEICLIYLPDRAAHESVHMLKNVHMAIAHVGPIVCRGEFHMGVDKTLATYIDELTGSYFPITNLDLHSIATLPAPLPRKADLILVNRAQMQLYYAV